MSRVRRFRSDRRHVRVDAGGRGDPRALRTSCAPNRRTRGGDCAPVRERRVCRGCDDSDLTVVTSELTPAVEEILERYARRARRIVAPAAETAHPSVNVEYVAGATIQI